MGLRPLLNWRTNVYSRHHRKLRILFGVSDVALVALAFAAAYVTRRALPLLFPLEHDFEISGAASALLLSFSCVCWVLAGIGLNVYERLDSARPSVILRDSLRQASASLAALVVFQYFLRLDLSRLFVTGFAAGAWLFICVFRLVSARLSAWTRRRFGALHQVVLAGTGPRAESLLEELEAAEHYGVRVVARLGDRPAPAEIQRLLAGHVIDEFIFAVGGEVLPDLEDVFLLCDEEGVRTRIAVDFFPHVNSELYLDRFGHTPLLTFAAAPHDEIRLMLKRALDFVVAAVAIVVLAPVMLLIVIAIRLTSPGRVVFSQQRCGLNGRLFTFHKFRSMVVNAEELKADLAHLNEKEIAFKIKDDPRLTPIGGFLRKFSLDELPQLWNVLKGDMSIVGPRPAVPDEVEQYKRWQRRRMRMRPGLTCLWALNGRDKLDFESWMKLDLEYIDSWSLGLDWKIMIETIPRVLTGKGAN